MYDDKTIKCVKSKGKKIRKKTEEEGTMLRNKQIRDFARRQLRGNWGAAVGGYYLELFLTLGALAILFFLGYWGVERYAAWSSEVRAWMVPLLSISIAALLCLHYVLEAALEWGYQRMLLRMVKGEQIHIGDAFQGFRMPKSVRNFLGVELFLTGLSLLFLIPTILNGMQYGVSSFNTTMGNVILDILHFIAGLFFAGAETFAVMDSGRSARKSLGLSVKTMEGRKLKYCGLMLSFVPLAMLTLIPFYMLTFVGDWATGSEVSIFWKFGLILLLGLLPTGFLAPYVSAAQTIFFLSAYSEDYQRGQNDSHGKETVEAVFEERVEEAQEEIKEEIQGEEL